MSWDKNDFVPGQRFNVLEQNGIVPGHFMYCPRTFKDAPGQNLYCPGASWDAPGQNIYVPITFLSNRCFAPRQSYFAQEHCTCPWEP